MDKRKKTPQGATVKKPKKNNLNKGKSARQPKKQTTSPAAIKRAEMLKKAMDLRKLSLTYDEINERLGGFFGSAKGTQIAVSRELEEIKLDSAIELKKWQNIQIMEVLSAVLPKAKNGNLLAVDRVDRLWRRQASLNGLDSPIKIAETDPSGEKEAAAKKVFLYLPANGREKNSPADPGPIAKNGDEISQTKK